MSLSTVRSVGFGRQTLYTEASRWTFLVGQHVSFTGGGAVTIMAVKDSKTVHYTVYGKRYKCTQGLI